eukprot:CAMPEP_0172661640 /NCGR_PEP_ID=MMETSP1074-20121228/4833_1 /TAXON_ID=2916 /ORGANISM="Ceratium fusus, Strain PA161109" /LENGTH=155 /DNA_ID=CAMNT_0013477439 /DNA_START=779 /DNA_END=1244 /DNA_ORIENTATION=-
MGCRKSILGLGEHKSDVNSDDADRGSSGHTAKWSSQSSSVSWELEVNKEECIVVPENESLGEDEYLCWSDFIVEKAPAAVSPFVPPAVPSPASPDFPVAPPNSCSSATTDLISSLHPYPHTCVEVQHPAWLVPLQRFPNRPCGPPSEVPGAGGAA